ncbi:Uncharacterised protein [Shigella sonnei]|nr:Uncharacterised protein [Shigella sonnei]
MYCQSNAISFTVFDNHVIGITTIVNVNVVVITGSINRKYLMNVKSISTICSNTNAFRVIVTGTNNNFYKVNLIIRINVITITTEYTKHYHSTILWDRGSCNLEITTGCITSRNRHFNVFDKHFINFGFGVCADFARSWLITFVIYFIAKCFLSLCVITVSFYA